MAKIIGTVTTHDVGELCPSGTWNVIEIIQKDTVMVFVTDEMFYDEDDGDVPFMIADVMVKEYHPVEVDLKALSGI